MSNFSTGALLLEVMSSSSFSHVTFQQNVFTNLPKNISRTNSAWEESGVARPTCWRGAAGTRCITLCLHAAQAGWPSPCSEGLGCRATRGIRNSPSRNKNLLFLRHPDVQSHVWVTPPVSQPFHRPVVLSTAAHVFPHLWGKLSKFDGLIAFVADNSASAFGEIHFRSSQKSLQITLFDKLLRMLFHCPVDL